MGYQAEGTLGKLIVDGAKEVTIFGEKVQVNAQIHNLEGFSGHADRDGLLSWIKGFQKEPKQIFLVHGEPQAKEDFADTVKNTLGYEPIVVKGNSEFVLEHDEIVDVETVMEDAVDEETLNNLRKNLFEIHRSIEDILYNTKLAVGEDISKEKMAKINNMVLELEKSTINLGAAVSEEDDGGQIQQEDI